MTKLFGFVILFAAITLSFGQEAVVTYHYDNLRTGWNSNETTLTPSNVNTTTFGLLQSVTLDEQVDAQPLIIPNEFISLGLHKGRHNVVYVATENNTIYAIDASTGVVLLNPNFGRPVPKPLGCNNNSSVVGITGTPVIDRANNSMYVIVYTLGNPNTNFLPAVPTYTIHELDLSNLKERFGRQPLVVTGSHKLTNGSTYNFNATVQRQRPALLEANGNIYAGFGSFCDFKTSSSRGWVLGWHIGTQGILQPLPANELVDTQTTPRSSYYLSSVWMSGHGLSADASGNVYFVTGNSDNVNNVYDGVTDIQESVVKVTPNLSMTGIFTPSDEFFEDQHDKEMSSSGVLLLPTQAGPIPNLAVAAGKEGVMYLLNQASLGGFTSTNRGIVTAVAIGACFCGESYFSSGVPHVVSSGGHVVHLWNLQTSPSVKLVSAGTQTISAGQDPGFFTSVSSSGSNDAIIWAVSHPATATSTGVKLFAINPQSSGGTLPMLFSAVAGSWTSLTANANIVPVVANGHVYVASNKQLTIFGLLNGATAKTIIPEPVVQNISQEQSSSEMQNVSSDSSQHQHEIFGTISDIDGSRITVKRRTGSLLTVDASVAIQNELCVELEVGEAIDVQGAFDADGAMLANSIQKAKDESDAWPIDN
jgi:hypothetical protein